ncbi:MAG: GNAT family N-acetyltransferase [Betaproteobacteria bacterium]
MVVDVTDANVEAARIFLLRHPETSLLLLSNLRAFGPRLGDSLYSGDFKALVGGGEIEAVWCLTRGGSLVAQSGGRADVAPAIVRSCAGDPLEVRGVLGEWTIASALWDRLSIERGLRPAFVSREISYRRRLDRLPPADAPARVRRLTPDDHPGWARLTHAFLAGQGLPEQGTAEQHRAAFVRSADLGHWWGAFEGDELVSIGGYNALHDTIAQVGGVFTPPERRGRGLSRAVMQTLMRDSVGVHHVDRLFLFTGPRNTAARAMYESLGFERFGHFGLFFAASGTC